MGVNYFICTKDYPMEKDGYEYTFKKGEIYEDAVEESFYDISGLFWIRYNRNYGCRFSKTQYIQGQCEPYTWNFRQLTLNEFRRLKLKKLKNLI